MKTVQTRRDFLKAAALSAAGLGLSRICRGGFGKPPNFVIIFLDDSGWADF
ncbi:MAG: twin-arginine translocation signal domain-containing protein, partial [Sedimentisphaerales bacterium]|nr:twin-arginine translocation signal domain-containing protein [Sedimentisphaerales bacterium]